MALTLAQIAKSSVNAQIAYCLDKHPTYDAALAEEIETLVAAPLLARIAELEKLSVTAIMLDVVPGDGSGYEVYAKSVADVETKLSDMGQELEDWQLGIRRLAAAPQPKPADCGEAGHAEGRCGNLNCTPSRAAQPVTHQFQARDGSWHGFIDERHMENTIKDGSWPIRALYTAPPKAVPLTDAQREVLAYLDGTGPLDGIWYGDKHPTEQGAYWWRKRLWAAFGTPATVEKEGE